MQLTKNPELTKLRMSLTHTRTGILTWKAKYEAGLAERLEKEAQLVEEIARLEAEEESK